MLRQLNQIQQAPLLTSFQWNNAHRLWLVAAVQQSVHAFYPPTFVRIVRLASSWLSDKP